MPDYTLLFPFTEIHFDFSRSGTGTTFITDIYGQQAKLSIEVNYPWWADPSPRNLRVTSATLYKNKTRYTLDTRKVRIQDTHVSHDDLLEEA